MSITLNEEDPCGTAKSLRQAYTNLIAGSGPSRITVRSAAGGAEKTVEFHRGDPETLNREVQRWEALCRESKGDTRPRRSALVAGGTLRRGPFGWR